MARDTTPQDRLTKLAIRMKKGDRRAAAELYDELLPKVHGFLFTRTSKREVAEDLAQDIFIKLIEKIDAYDETRGAFVVWFWQMTRRTLIDHYRKKQETPFSQFADDEVAAMAVSEGIPNMDTKLEHGKLFTFVKSLGDEERELFEYRYVAEMAYGDIAKLTGKTEGALRVAALRIKEKIKKELRFS